MDYETLEKFERQFWEDYPISQYVRVDGNILSWILSKPDEFAEIFGWECR